MKNGAKAKPVPDWLIALFILLAIVGGYVIGEIAGLDRGRWFLGLVIFIFLIIIWAFIHVQIERRKFNRYLASFPPGQRLAALDERFGGVIKRLTETPEYRRAAGELQKKFEKRLRSIHDIFEQTPGPLSFSAQKQLDAAINELKKELDAGKTR